MTFDGAVLERGFWLYVWKIEDTSGTYFYVGRTGDSSSPHASSPFNRIGQHLDFRANAKGNALAKRLKAEGVSPQHCKFSMLAAGPIFSEQETFTAHVPYRDQMATLESKVANFIREKGFSVLGVHHPKAKVDDQLTQSIFNKVEPFIKHVC